MLEFSILRDKDESRDLIPELAEENNLCFDLRRPALENASRSRRDGELGSPDFTAKTQSSHCVGMLSEYSDS